MRKLYLNSDLTNKYKGTLLIKENIISPFTLDIKMMSVWSVNRLVKNDFGGKNKKRKLRKLFCTHYLLFLSRRPRYRIPRIPWLVLTAVRIFLSLPTGAVTLSWVAENIPSFFAIFHVYILFCRLGSIYKQIKSINNLLILSFLFLKSLCLPAKIVFKINLW